MKTTRIQEKIIQETVTIVTLELSNAEGGHDWFHICILYPSDAADEENRLILV